MSTSWQINGLDISDSNVVVTVEPGTLKSDHPIRVQDVKRLHDGPKRHQLGTEFPTYTWRFRFIGADTYRHARLQSVKATLKTSTSFTLTAPDTGEVFFDGSERSVILTLNSLAVVYEEGVGATALDVVAVQINPKDVTGETTGFFRGMAQVLNGACQRIDDPALALAFGDVILRNDAAPATDQAVLGVTKLRDEAAPAGDAVVFGDSVRIDNGGPITQEFYLTVRAGQDAAPVTAELLITNV